MANSLYIHIPFCTNLCSYCDFCKIIYHEDLANAYINKLLQDLDQNNKYKTIYIGGGSPSSLSMPLLQRLLERLSNMLEDNYEFSIEVNPNDLTYEKAKILKKYKINRVSLGVQTFNNKLLKLINRSHTYKDIISCINLLKENGITNISCDLMYGLPHQSFLSLLNDLNKLIKLDIPHISTYALQIEPNTKFYIDKVVPLSDDIQSKQYNFINKYLKKHGYNRYEISNFSKPSFESKHNLVYWNAKEYKGLGAGASGYENNIRYTYTNSVKNYIDSSKIIEQESLSNEDKIYEYIILHLRLKEGINIESFNQEFNLDFTKVYQKEIEELLKQDLIEIKNGHLYVKEDKMFVLNTVLLQFTK